MTHSFDVFSLFSQVILGKQLITYTKTI